MVDAPVARVIAKRAHEGTRLRWCNIDAATYPSFVHKGAATQRALRPVPRKAVVDSSCGPVPSCSAI